MNTILVLLMLLLILLIEEYGGGRGREIEQKVKVMKDKAEGRPRGM